MKETEVAWVIWQLYDSGSSAIVVILFPIQPFIIHIAETTQVAES